VSILGLPDAYVQARKRWDFSDLNSYAIVVPVAGCAGLAFGLLDEWLSGQEARTPAGLGLTCGLAREGLPGICVPLLVRPGHRGGRRPRTIEDDPEQRPTRRTGSGSSRRHDPQAHPHAQIATRYTSACDIAMRSVV
jgi:hypothetical protein